MALSATDIVMLASQLRAIGVTRIVWGDLELELNGGIQLEAGEGVPLTPDEPPQSAYDSALKRMAKRA